MPGNVLWLAPAGVSSSEWEQLRLRLRHEDRDSGRHKRPAGSATRTGSRVGHQRTCLLFSASSLFCFVSLIIIQLKLFFLHMIFFYLLNAKRCSVLKLTCSSQVEFYILVALATGRALSKPSNTASWLRPGRPCQHWEKIQLVLVPHTWSEIRSRKKMH